MNPNFPRLILVLGLVTLGFVGLRPVFFHAETTSPAPVVSEILKANPSEKIASASSNIAVRPSTNVSAAVAHLTNHPAQTVETLRALAMSGEAGSLPVILAELTNADPQIRLAARAAAVQFGDRAAIPSLRAAVAQVESPHEKVALLEAADFLELPPLEVRPATNPHPSKLAQPTLTPPPVEPRSP